MDSTYIWNRMNAFHKVLFVCGLWLLLSLFVSSAKVSATGGQLSNTIPNNGSAQPWLVVTRPGSNGMDANDQTVSAYVPMGYGGFNMSIENACDTTVQDAGDTAGNDTFFAFFDTTNVTASGNATPGTPYAVAPGTPLWIVQCGSGSNLVVNVTVGPTAPIVTVNGISYRQVNIQASITNPVSPFYYVNRFRYTATPGVYLGYAISQNPTIPRDYTGIAYDNSAPNNWGWSTKIAFGQACGVGGQAASVKFWDTDHTNAGNAASPYWQDNTHPMQYNIRAYNRASGIDQGIVDSGNLTGGNNVADQTPSITYWSDNYYVIEIANINFVNSIQVALPFSQFMANDTCSAGPSCAITSVTDTSGGTIQAGEQIVFTVTTANAAGYDLGVNGPAWAPNGTYGNYLVSGNQYVRTPVPANGVNFLASLYANVDGGPYTTPMFAPNAPGTTQTFNWGLVQPGVGWAAPPRGICNMSFDITPNIPLPTVPVVSCIGITFGSREYGVADALVTTISNDTGPSGAPITISASYAAPGAVLSVPVTYYPNPVPGGGTHSDITQTATFPTAGAYAITTTVNYTDGVNSGAIVCPGTVTVYGIPYLKAFGSDVSAGGSFNPACAPVTDKSIYAFAKGSGSNYTGASGQFGVLALMNINQFFSASNRTSLNVPPKGTTFGNKAGLGDPTYGGAFGGGGICITDYYNATQLGGLTNAGQLTAIAASAPAGITQYKISSGNLIGGASVTIPLGRQVAVYIAGDLFIDGNIMLASGAGSRSDIPNFALIVLGNIYIGSGVTRLDGLYVAQPDAPNKGKIYTCASGLGTLYTAAQMGVSCANQLSVNGAVVAQQIKFYRTYKSLNDSTIGEKPTSFANGGPGTNAAEVINFTPEMYMAPSPLKDPNGGVTSGKYDAIFSLPPIF